MADTVPAIAGWFTDDPAPTLLGTRCGACGTVCFPGQQQRCPNPNCGSDQLSEHRLSNRGVLWSYTDARYQPPPPYVPTADPHQPFAIAAVHLEAEAMVVLGQVPDDVATTDLEVGLPMRLVIEPLFTNDEGTTHTVWKWRPDPDTGAGTDARAGTDVRAGTDDVDADQAVGEGRR
ncbi:MAG: OB-fold domain-containing protein [Acidimicrobiia bacterium]|nr:OB-fold domain-containing protein [Acidimicrobiia bacterium]